MKEKIGILPVTLLLVIFISGCQQLSNSAGENDHLTLSEARLSEVHQKGFVKGAAIADEYGFSAMGILYEAPADLQRIEKHVWLNGLWAGIGSVVRTMDIPRPHMIEPGDAGNGVKPRREDQ